MTPAEPFSRWGDRVNAGYSDTSLVCINHGEKIMKFQSLRNSALACAISIALLPAAATAAKSEFSSKDGLVLHAEHTAPGYQLRVTAPDGSVYEEVFVGNQPIRLRSEQLKQGWADGAYLYEITPVQGQNIRPESQAGGVHVKPISPAESGAFRIEGGHVFLSTDAPEPNSAGAPHATSQISAWQNVPSQVLTPQDQVTADDLIVQGSACIGLDCVNNESFGFDTLRLKENNTRIKFDDTSTSAGFAANDWQLTANDSASGGLNKFSVEDVTGSKVPFTLLAGAPNNSFFMSSIGDIGMGTSTPALDLHINRSDTPAIRFEQNNSGGFAAQTWDVAGNEANFFVRDVTGGSRLPFRIRPGAPTSSIDISATGNVGIGTASPSQALDVARSGDVVFRLSNTSPVAPNNEWDIKNNAATGRLTFTDDSTGARVPFKFAPNAVDNLLRIGVLATNTVDINGNLFVTGTITPDYVFDKSFRLPSIKEHSEAMWESRHLPKMTPATVNEHGQGVINVGERSQGMLEELEYAHVYIDQLHSSLQQLQDDMAKKNDEVAQLREEIASIKASLDKR